MTASEKLKAAKLGEQVLIFWFVLLFITFLILKV
jgi:hypothetical protein